MADETGTDDMNSASNETTEPAAEAAEAENVEEVAAEAPTPKKPVSPERAADITLGVGVVAFEAFDRVARSLDATVRRLVEDSPAVFAELEEKGRPLREKIAETLRGRSTGDGATSDTGAASAADEITALEDRVRELEQQVGEPAAPADPSPFSMLEIDPPAEPAEPAEPPKGRSRRKADEKSEEPAAEE